MLKYFYTATYEDGSTYIQNESDVSNEDPKRSCFTDVLAIAEKKRLVAFVLKGDGHEYGVDLRDGHFEIDGVPFRMHEMPTRKVGQKDHADPLKDFRIVFFRRHTHSFTQTRERDTEVSHEVAYRIGWQAKTESGVNYQRVMEID